MSTVPRNESAADLRIRVDACRAVWAAQQRTDEHPYVRLARSTQQYRDLVESHRAEREAR
jgi:hypothetical protein